MLWEKSRGSGGRFCTDKLSRGEEGGAFADLGAQYITKGAGHEPPQSWMYDLLLSNGVIQPFHGSVDGAAGSHAEQARTNSPIATVQI